MKALSTVFILIFVIFIVYMFQYVDSLSSVYNKDICDRITRSAIVAMAGRQQGEDIDDTSTRINNLDMLGNSNQKLKQINDNLVAAAYIQKQHLNELDQQKEIELFSQKSFYKYCIYNH